MEFCAHTAREAYELARERHDNASAVIGFLNEFLPVLNLIGLDRLYAVNGLNAVAVAAVIASKIDPEHRSWNWQTAISPRQRLRATACQMGKAHLCGERLAQTVLYLWGAHLAASRRDP